MASNSNVSPIPHALTPIVPPSEVLVEERARGWFSGLKERFSRFDLNLPNPGKFEDYNRESKEITSMQDFSDGCKLEFQKTLSEHFGVNHILSMGQEDYKGGGAYTFIATLLSRNKKAFTMGRFDGDGKVFGRFTYSPTDNLSLLASSQVSLAENQSTLSLEADYRRGDTTATVKWEKPGFVELAVMQGLTRHSGLGVSIMHIPQPGGSMQGTQLAYKLWSGEDLTRMSGTAPRWAFTAALSTMVPFTSSFLYRTQRADIAAEYSFTPSMDRSGNMESQLSLGTSFDFRSSRIRCKVDQDWKVTAIVEEFVSPILKVSMMGDLDHWNHKYKFGIGASFFI